MLTHRGHTCMSKPSITVSDNVLLPGRREGIIWTNTAILLIETLGTIFSEIWSEIHAFSFKKMHLKMSSAKWRSYYNGFDVFRQLTTAITHGQSIWGLVNLARNHPTKWFTQNYTRHVDDLMQDCSFSCALAMELLPSCTKPLTYTIDTITFITYIINLNMTV